MMWRRGLPAATLLALAKPGASAWMRQLSSAAAAGPLQFCIVGSGPAGFYTADKVGGLERRS